MKSNRWNFLVATILCSFILSLCLTGVVHAADYASFESFYQKSGGIWGWVIGGVLACAGVALVFVSTGFAAPFVASIGSAIGGLMGLSGAAATSAGLAWLGGGALAAGGLGVVGGSALLTAIFECTVLGGTQYYEYYSRKKDYQELCEQVKDYPTLPPIQNSDGPAEVKLVVESLERHYRLDSLPSSEPNTEAVKHALYETLRWKAPDKKFYSIGYEEKVRREKLRMYSLQAILYFMGNDYKEAFKHAGEARYYHFETKDDGPASVPNFVYSVSGVFTEELPINISLNIFHEAIKSEPENLMIPQLFSIYISRLGAKNAIDYNVLYSLGGTAKHITDTKIRYVAEYQIMTAITAKLWEIQQLLTFYSDNSDSIDEAEFFKNTQTYQEEYKKILDYGQSYSRFLLDSKDSKARDEYHKFTILLQKYGLNIEKLLTSIDKISSDMQNRVSKDAQPENTDQKNEAPQDSMDQVSNLPWDIEKLAKEGNTEAKFQLGEYLYRNG